MAENLMEGLIREIERNQELVRYCLSNDGFIDSRQKLQKIIHV